MLILGLDAALARASAAVVRDGTVLAERVVAGERGQAAVLPPLLASVLAEAGVTVADLDAVAVTVGPGSFTGVRAALALAHGLALAGGKPVLGVTVAEALAAALPATRRTVWCAIDSRRGRVFLDIAGTVRPCALEALPPAAGPVAVTGDAAVAVAVKLAARGDNVQLTDARLPRAADVARVGAKRLAGALPPLPAQPLYVDPPEARLPAGGLRPAPAG
ncbi:MAG TPA: tRNA (adenosine(37)-N6)-threonylcarbamoyltransferase complex dimerization subunit type 1 TsaB [Candidatus Sulfotelmatobacter sp.]|nr:tRNA (adenosine(37)-N6)-threonylcarbamoyltransferase complex dimerization subunit type 1 TsaB [Candidatus Sulfotelmatobacter sp.]